MRIKKKRPLRSEMGFQYRYLSLPFGCIALICLSLGTLLIVYGLPRAGSDLAAPDGANTTSTESPAREDRGANSTSRTTADCSTSLVGCFYSDPRKDLAVPGAVPDPHLSEGARRDVVARENDLREPFVLQGALLFVPGALLLLASALVCCLEPDRERLVITEKKEEEEEVDSSVRAQPATATATAKTPAPGTQAQKQYARPGAWSAVVRTLAIRPGRTGGRASGGSTPPGVQDRSEGRRSLPPAGQGVRALPEGVGVHRGGGASTPGHLGSCDSRSSACCSASQAESAPCRLKESLSSLRVQRRLPNVEERGGGADVPAEPWPRTAVQRAGKLEQRNLMPLGQDVRSSSCSCKSRP